MIEQTGQARLQCHQMAGQVAAVDRRHVDRMQRLQALGVIPVVEMAMMALQLAHRAQGVGSARDELAGADVTEVVGRQIGQQRHPDIGRRSPVRDHQYRVFLHVVGR